MLSPRKNAHARTRSGSRRRRRRRRSRRSRSRSGVTRTVTHFHQVHAHDALARPTLVLVLALALAVSCAGRTGGGDDAGDTTPPTDPAIHFFVDERPQDEGPAPVRGHPRGAEAVAGRYGDPFTIVVDGLAPQSRVSLVAHLNGMTSRMRFDAGDDGVIDLAQDAPVDDDADDDNRFDDAENAGGTYAGVDAEGFLWSMLPDDGPPPAGLDLTVRVEVRADDSGALLVEGAFARRYIDDGLTVEDVQSGRTTGALVIPPGDGPFPAVLCFGGSEGGTGTGVFDALYLGSLGYAALGVGYFGAAGVPDRLDEVPLEILEEDLAFLTADPRVDPDRIAVKGGSRGGELALILGAHFPVVKAVIGDVPSGVVWPGDSFPDYRSAWTLDGAPLPFIPDTGTGAPDVTIDDDGNQHVTSTPIFLADLAAASPDDIAAATTHVEDTGGPILLLAGGADALWPSCALADIAFQRLVASGHAAQFPDASHCFADAGHLIGTPGWSTNAPQEVFEASLGAYLVTGGTPAGMALADRGSDTAIRKFLEENL